MQIKSYFIATHCHLMGLPINKGKVVYMPLSVVLETSATMGLSLPCLPLAIQVILTWSHNWIQLLIHTVNNRCGRGCRVLWNNPSSFTGRPLPSCYLRSGIGCNPSDNETLASSSHGSSGNYWRLPGSRLYVQRWAACHSSWWQHPESEC